MMMMTKVYCTLYRSSSETKKAYINPSKTKKKKKYPVQSVQYSHAAVVLSNSLDTHLF